MSDVYDPTSCELGEGPLWHPLREQLFWFDILNARLLTREGGKTRQVQFGEIISAAGWVNDHQLLIASERRFFLYDVDRDHSEDVEGLEADDPTTRPNDGRADPWGGFWISTMSKEKVAGAARIYRFYQGKLTPLIQDLTIPNAICFAPDRSCAYYTDTVTGKVMRQPLDRTDGWPEGDATVFLDLTDEGLHPDGAVVDQAGNFWNAQWGAWRVACYSPEGEAIGKVAFNAAHTSCPAFGGPGLTTLFCTSAREHLSDEDAARSDQNGMTFAFPDTGKGQAEHQVLL